MDKNKNHCFIKNSGVMEEIIIIINQVLKSFGLSAKIEERNSLAPGLWVTVNEANTDGETLIFELSKCINPGGKNSLPALWYKKGYTKTFLSSFWSLKTFVSHEKYGCFRAYDPTVKDDGQINFDYILEATPENAGEIVTEMIRRFLSA